MSFTFSYFMRTPLNVTKRTGKKTKPTHIEYVRRYGPTQWVGPRTPGDNALNKFKARPLTTKRVGIQTSIVLNPKTMKRTPVDLELSKKIG